MIIGVKRLFAFYFYRTQIIEDYQFLQTGKLFIKVEDDLPV